MCLLSSLFPTCLYSYRGVHRQDTVFDSIVFRRVQELFGGRVRLVVTGSAPIPRDVLRFFRIALGCPVFEGYGQTETCTCGTFTIAKETDAGHVGPPVATMAIKLVDVPELDYFSKNDEGEVCTVCVHTYLHTRVLFYGKYRPACVGWCRGWVESV